MLLALASVLRPSHLLRCEPTVLCAAAAVTAKSDLLDELKLPGRPLSVRASTLIEQLAVCTSVDSLCAPGKWRFLSYDSLQDQLETMDFAIPSLRACTVDVDCTPDGRF